VKARQAGGSLTWEQQQAALDATMLRKAAEVLRRRCRRTFAMRVLVKVLEDAAQRLERRARRDDVPGAGR